MFSILLLGDVLVDRYIHIHQIENQEEDGSKAYTTSSSSPIDTAGGAGNVLGHLLTLAINSSSNPLFQGVKIDLLTDLNPTSAPVISDLQRLLPFGIVGTGKQGNTTVINRYFLNANDSQPLLRIDVPDKVKNYEELESEIALPRLEYDIGIISDYDQGNVIPNRISLLREHCSRLIVDPRKRFPGGRKVNLDFYHLADLICPSLDEWTDLTGSRIICENRNQKNTIVIKAGREGAYLLEPGSKPVQFPGYPIKNFVSSLGAGDAFLASLVWFYLESKDLHSSIRAANYLAAQTCTRHRCGYISLKDLQSVRNHIGD